MQAPAPEYRGRAEPELRGSTAIADRVLERIAAIVVDELEHAGGTARRVLGVQLGKDGTEAAPKVNASVDGHVATVSIRLSVVYPAPIRAVTREVRQRVMNRVAELTGVRVGQVDIDIARLVPPRRVRRVQ
jgi:uncharacterized alkaline shock family protein YloU